MQRSISSFARRMDIRVKPHTFYPLIAIEGGAVNDTLNYRLHPHQLAFGGLLAFSLLYMTFLWSSFSKKATGLHVTMLGIALTATTSILSITLGGHMLDLFLPTTVACSVAATRRKVSPITVIATLSVAGAFFLLAIQGEPGEAFELFYGSAASGVVAVVIINLTTSNQLLRMTRAELAEVAVAEERLRFARDLHDLLGSSMSLIVVKAEAIRRIAGHDTTAVKRHATDIENTSRSTLQQIREAVTGYRESGLAAELDGARALLHDAGVATIVRNDGPPLPAEADVLLGWAVREGVTNVLRHSNARTCEIDIAQREGQIMLKIDDDGRGWGSSDPFESPGNGLRGLTERMATVGGAIHVSSPRQGGFSLKITLPVNQPKGHSSL